MNCCSLIYSIGAAAAAAAAAAAGRNFQPSRWRFATDQCVLASVSLARL